MRYLFLLILSVSMYACQNNDGSAQMNKVDTIPSHDNLDISIKGNFSPQRSLLLPIEIIDQFFQEHPLVQQYDSTVHQFYQMRNGRYAWFDENGLTEPANNLFNRLSNLKEEGLKLYPPYIDLLDSLMMADHILSTPKDQQTEILLTTLYFYYAKHVWEGLSEEESIAQEWYLPRKKINAADLLDSILSNPEDLSKLGRPVYRQYYLLKDALKKYHQIAEQGGWDSIQTQKTKIQVGDSLTEVLQIKQRLKLSGEYPLDDSTAIFNEELLIAVKNFQENHGLEPDGVVGPAVLRALNTSVDKRIEQIMVNMERCRWMPAHINREYLVVNIPDYKLFAFSGDSLLWQMNVVVGQALHKTVIFSGELKYVVFSPYWNVPNSIYKAEILPAMKKDSTYLKRNNMEIHGGTVRQKPGPNNSLGLVKFLFPNSYNIYLHDTPSKSLFSKSSRAFSHGCIRVENPLFLSKYLLKEHPEWTEEKIIEAMHNGKERYIQLKETVPVYIAYLTAWVSSTGAIQFRNDIYQRDERLKKSIFNQ